MDEFRELPDDAHVWIYAADRRLSEPAEASLTQTLTGLMDTWSSHGKRVEGAWKLMDSRLVIVAAYVPDGTLSGCGIDKSLHALQKTAAEFDFSWVSGLAIIYRDGSGSVQTASRPEFRRLAETGSVDASVPVIDLSIDRLGDLREHGLERPAGASWHAKLFGLDSEETESAASSAKAPA